jgi:hypothetical protein
MTRCMCKDCRHALQSACGTAFATKQRFFGKFAVKWRVFVWRDCTCDWAQPLRVFAKLRLAIELRLATSNQPLTDDQVHVVGRWEPNFRQSCTHTSCTMGQLTASLAKSSKFGVFMCAPQPYAPSSGLMSSTATMSTDLAPGGAGGGGGRGGVGGWDTCPTRNCSSLPCPQGTAGAPSRKSVQEVMLPTGPHSTHTPHNGDASHREQHWALDEATPVETLEVGLCQHCPCGSGAPVQFACSRVAPVLLPTSTLVPWVARLDTTAVMCSTTVEVTATRHRSNVNAI